MLRLVLWSTVLLSLGGNTLAQTTHVMNIQSDQCIREPDGTIQCPADPLTVDELFAELLLDGEVSGAMCNFGAPCVDRLPLVVGLPLKVCTGEDFGAEPIQIDAEVLVMAAGSSTIVPTFTPVDPAANPPEHGHGLKLINSISCFSVTDCNCSGSSTPTCVKGAVNVFALARYEIDPRLGCVSSGTGGPGAP